MANYDPNLDKKLEEKPIEPMTYEKASAQMSMKFYNHLVKWILWLAALANLSYGVLYLTGAYGSGIPELVKIERFQGFMGIVIALLLVFARFQLKKFSILGPVALYAAQLVNIVHSIISVIRTKAVLSSVNIFVKYGVYVSVRGVIPSILPAVVILTILYLYFSKRNHLFYN